MKKLKEDSQQKNPEKQSGVSKTISWFIFRRTAGEFLLNPLKKIIQEYLQESLKKILETFLQIFPMESLEKWVKKSPEAFCKGIRTENPGRYFEETALEGFPKVSLVETVMESVEKFPKKIPQKSLKDLLQEFLK